MKYDFNKVSKETMVTFFDNYVTGGPGCGKEWAKAWQCVREEAEVKLRTRAEVDADIAKVIREYYSYHDEGNCIKFDAISKYKDSHARLAELCKEETQG